MRIGGLFSGVGGLELGLEMAGVGQTVFQVEADSYCREVLAKHWPNAERFNDVREVGAHNLPRVDVICGGFPCQDLSYAGKGAGLEGQRSGLWFEYARIIRELRPSFVVVENVRALLTRGIDRVLGTLAELGYDAEWRLLRASDVGAPHRRERIFIIAWLADADSDGRQGSESARATSGVRRRSANESEEGVGLADADVRRCEGLGLVGILDGVWETHGDDANGCSSAHSEGVRETESRLGRIADGVRARMDGRWPARPGESQHEWEAPRTVTGKVDRRRLKACGNAVVPQCAEVIGLRLMEIANR